MGPVRCPARDLRLPCHARYLEHFESKEHRRAATSFPHAPHPRRLSSLHTSAPPATCACSSSAAAT
eukprot:11197651-Lingulodinium_polyedra.AAC.1